jgi:hypothetical protein
MNKKCFIVVLAIQLHLMGMEPVPSITPSIESEFLELLQRFDATDAVCREKKFALLNEQAFLLQELQKKLHHQSLQTLGNYALFNAYFLKKISNTVLLLIETKKLSDTNPSDHIFYQNLPDSLLQARKWILEATEDPTYFNDFENYALNELSINIHHALFSIIPQKNTLPLPLPIINPNAVIIVGLLCLR